MTLPSSQLSSLIFPVLNFSLSLSLSQPHSYIHTHTHTHLQRNRMNGSDRCGAVPSKLSSRLICCSCVGEGILSDLLFFFSSIITSFHQEWSVIAVERLKMIPSKLYCHYKGFSNLQQSLTFLPHHVDFGSFQHCTHVWPVRRFVGVPPGRGSCPLTGPLPFDLIYTDYHGLQQMKQHMGLSLRKHKSVSLFSLSWQIPFISVSLVGLMCAVCSSNLFALPAAAFRMKYFAIGLLAGWSHRPVNLFCISKILPVGGIQFGLFAQWSIKQVLLKAATQERWVGCPLKMNALSYAQVQSYIQW